MAAGRKKLGSAQKLPPDLPHNLHLHLLGDYKVLLSPKVTVKVGDSRGIMIQRADF